MEGVKYNAAKLMHEEHIKKTQKNWNFENKNLFKLKKFINIDSKIDHRR